MSRILIASIAFGLFISCNNDVTHSSEENPLLGEWAEQFSWTNTFDCVTIGWDTQCSEVTETSTIEFTEGTFEVKILPPTRTYIVEDDTIYVGWAGDTLYAGEYDYNNDTITFYFNDDNEPEIMRFSLQNDSLSLSALSESIMVVMDGDTSYLASFSIVSFMWGNAWGKTHGTFGKVE